MVLKALICRSDLIVWGPIHGGLILLALGLSVQRIDLELGWRIAAPGITLALAGVLMIWLRSRMTNDARPPATPRSERGTP
jgi:hypothetical protein